MSRNRVLILYDNRTRRDVLIPGGGFSALIELDGKRILFDAGADFLVLKHNAQVLGVNLEAIDLLFLSHDHCDHIGGVPAVRRKGLEVYYPASFSSSFGEMMESAKARAHPVSRAAEIIPGIHSTGELEGIVLGTSVREQALVIAGGDGPVLITGCAHPGIVDVARLGTEIVGESLHLVLGGFHLIRTESETVREVASDLKGIGVRQIAPCHCTGERAMEILQAEFGNTYTGIELGGEIVLR